MRKRTGYLSISSTQICVSVKAVQLGGKGRVKNVLMDFVHLLNIIKLQDEFQFHQAKWKTAVGPVLQLGPVLILAQPRG
jgi:hypothetical protein